MGAPESAIQISWIYSAEDESIARDLMRLAGVLEGLGLVRNRAMGPGLTEPLFAGQHMFGDGIAVFLVSPTARESGAWLSRLHQALAERSARTVLVLVRPIKMDELPEQARRAVILPKDETPIATRRDSDDALLAVIQALQEMAAARHPGSGKVSAALPAGSKRRGGIRRPLSINDIFRLNGPPTVTFVEPPQFRELQLELGTMGTGLIVEGPSKTGKSTAIRKAMEALGVPENDQLWWPGQSPPPLEEFRRTLDELRRSDGQRWLFIDDFHYLEDRAYLQTLAFTMKALADQSRSSAKVTLIGINPLGASLVQAMPDLAGRFRILRTDRERDWERSKLITELIVRGERAANITFRQRDEFVVAAAGSFFIAQLLCNRAAVQAGVYQTQRQTVEIELGPADVIASIRDELAARYRGPMLQLAAFDIQPPPRGAGLSLLWLLARSPDGFVSLKEARLRFPSQVPALDWFLQSNLTRCFEEHPDLRGLLYFNRATGTLTMEDPQLKFYLRAIDWPELAETSGHGHVEFHPADGPLWPLVGQSDIAVGAGARVEASADEETTTRRLLHLSDLHFATADQATTAYSQLSLDLRQQRVERLDALVISGDLVNRATSAEYAAAALFIEHVKSGFGLRANAVVLVPGNHDVSWPHGDSSYRLVRRAQHVGDLLSGTYIEHSAEVIEVRDEDAYRQRFAPFAELYEKVKGEPYPLVYDEQAILTHLPEAGLCIVGLNSAWEIDRHFRDRASLPMSALAQRLQSLPPPAPGELRIATFHHPIHSDEDSRLRDSAFLQQLAVAGFRLILHGHVHRADAALYRYDRTVNGRQIDIVTAGTFGAPVREWVPGYPLQYNLLEIHGREIVVETRCRREVNGAWEPDARWQQGPGKDPLPRYTLPR